MTSSHTRALLIGIVAVKIGTIMNTFLSSANRKEMLMLK